MSVQEIEQLVSQLHHSPNQHDRSNANARLNEIYASSSALEMVVPLLTTSSSVNGQFAGVAIVQYWAQGKRWKSIPEEYRSNIREFMWQYLVGNYRTLDFAVSNTIVRVIIIIGMADWPKRWPDFLNRVVGATNTRETSILGAYILKVLSEEAISGRLPATAKRRLRIKNELLAQVPNILIPLSDILKTVFTASTRIEQDGSIVNNFSPEAKMIAKHTLEAVAQYFSWVPLDRIVQFEQLKILFQYVGLGDENSVGALECLNEVVGQHYVPQSKETFLGGILSEVFSLLQRMTSSSLSSISPTFIEKFSEFTALFVKNHLTRDLPFTLVELLDLLLKYTDLQVSSSGLLQCLDIWDSLVDFFKMKWDSDGGKGQQGYGQVFVNLALLLVRKMTFKHTSNVLEELQIDDEVEEDDEMNEGNLSQQSEYDEYITRCLNLLTEVAIFFPDAILGAVGPELTAHLMTLHQGMQTLHEHNIYDGLVAVRGVASLVQFFVGDNISTHYQTARDMFTLMMNITSDCLQQGVHKRDGLPLKLVSGALASLRSYTQWLSAIWQYLATTQDSTGQLITEWKALVERELNLVLSVLSPNEPEPISKSAASLLVSLCTYLRYPGLLMLETMSGMLQNLHTASSVLPVSTQSLIYCAISNALVVSWYPTNADQQWDAREMQHVDLMRPHIGLYFATQDKQNELEPLMQLVASDNVANAALVPEVSSGVERVLAILSAVASGASTAETNKRGLIALWKTLDPALGASLKLIAVYNRRPASLLKILKFIYKVFDSLVSFMPQDAANTSVSYVTRVWAFVTKQHAGVPVRRAANSVLLLLCRTFIDTFGSPDSLAAIMQSSDKAGIAILQTFLGIARLLCSTPFTSLLENLVVFSVGYVSPVIKNSDNPSPLFEMYAKFFQHHGSHIINNEKLMTAVMNDFHWAFSIKEVECSRIVIRTLIEAGEKRRLFDGGVFKAQFAIPWMSTLLMVLLTKAQDLVRDGMCQVLYMIASKSWEEFYMQFLPGFIDQSNLTSHLSPELKQRMLEAFGQPTDQPTFQARVESAIEDFTYYASI